MVSHSMEDIAGSVDRLLVVNDAQFPWTGTPERGILPREELEAMGLDVPQVTRIFGAAPRGWTLPTDASVYTIDAGGCRC